MSRRNQVSTLAAAAAGVGLLALTTTVVLGQVRVPATKPAKAVKVSSAVPQIPVQNPNAPKTTPVPLNADDGHPDLTGMWDYRTATPMQRAKEDGTNLFLTQQDAEARAAKTTAARNTDIRSSNPEVDALQLGLNNAWYEYGGPYLGYRSSQIVDPPDGRMPARTPEAQAGMMFSSYSSGQFFANKKYATADANVDSAKVRGQRERCLQVGSNPPFGPDAWNSNILIVHRKDYVTLQTEMIHTARIVWLDGRPHINPNIKKWVGDSRGRWEGDTLVITTKNFRPDANWLSLFHPENFTLVERLMRIDGDTVLYEYTINDPETYVRPWTVQIPMRKYSGNMFEYACHEGNYGIKFQLSAARNLEKQAAQAKPGADKK